MQNWCFRTAAIATTPTAVAPTPTVSGSDREGSGRRRGQGHGWVSSTHLETLFFFPSFTDYYYFQIRYKPLSPPYNHRMQPKRRYKYLFSFFLATNVLFIYLEFNNEESKVEGNRQSAACYIWSVSLSRRASWPLIVSSTVKGFVLFWTTLDLYNHWKRPSLRLQGQEIYHQSSSNFTFYNTHHHDLH